MPPGRRRLTAKDKLFNAIQRVDLDAVREIYAEEVVTDLRHVFSAVAMALHSNDAGGKAGAILNRVVRDFAENSSEGLQLLADNLEVVAGIVMRMARQKSFETRFMALEAAIEAGLPGSLARSNGDLLRLESLR